MARYAVPAFGCARVARVASSCTGFEGEHGEFVSNRLRGGWKKMMESSMLAVIEGRDREACHP